MNILPHQLWIGLGFSVLLVAFLIITFFTSKNLTPDQRTILKFLSSLCAAFAGGLITGDALFKMEGNFGAGPKFVISGAAGAALFFVVWFFFPKVAGFPEGFSISIPRGWTFKNAVDTLVEQDGAVCDFDGLTSEELAAVLTSRELKTKTVSEAIRLLRSITKVPNAVRNYEVKYENSVYYLVVR